MTLTNIQFGKELHKIIRLHRNGAGGIQTALALTNRLDSLLQVIFKQLESKTNSLSVVALGGYGRKELCFSSDTDIMFLIADGNQRQATTPAVQELLYKLLDWGLDVGHSLSNNPRMSRNCRNRY